MILKPGATRMHRRDAWKESWYAFVPYQTHFGELCGFADDIVEGGHGFDVHPHRNMEISTIVLSGSQAHKDDTGRSGILGPNAVQTMSAGTGIMHSEFNASESDSFQSYQIWVYPKQKDVAPRYDSFSYRAEDKLNKILLTISPDGRGGTAKINQDAFFSSSLLEKNTSVEYCMHLPGNGVYIHCAKGSIRINDTVLNESDAAGIYECDSFVIHCEEKAEVVCVEVPMHRGISI